MLITSKWSCFLRQYLRTAAVIPAQAGTHPPYSRRPFIALFLYGQPVNHKMEQAVQTR